MAKGKRKGSAKPKSGKGSKKNKKGGKINPDHICANCHDKEGTENQSCEHYFCKDCFENLATTGEDFKCFICEDTSVNDVDFSTSAYTGSQNRFVEKLPPVDTTPPDFATLGKGIKKLSSFTHLAFDTVERIVIDRNEMFICVNPVDHKIYLFKDGKFVKGVKYLFNHGFTGGLALTYDGQILITLQGRKFTSVSLYTPDGKFRKSAFFQKGAYSHSIAVGTNNAIFALDAESNAIHFFSRERKMCQSWTLQSASAQGIDLWDCSLLSTKDNKLLLFDAANCHLYEIVSDDEIVLRVSFTEENVASIEQSGDSETESTASLPVEEYDSMWTKRRLSYTSDDDENTATETEDDAKNETKNNEASPAAKSTPVESLLHDILEDSENTQGNSSEAESTSEKTKSGKKGKKGKGGKKKKGANLNKNNNANGGIAEDKPSQPVKVQQKKVKKEFDPRAHPSLLVVDKYDCMLVAHRGKIALFSPDGQYIKSIVELGETEGPLYKITIKSVVPFGSNKVAVLWHKHGGGTNMYRFVEVYSYKVPRKYRRIKSSYGIRKFTYETDTDFENWMEDREGSKCCVVQ